MTRALRWLLLATASLACTAAPAQREAKAPGPAAKVSRQLVEQKEAFVKRLLSDSPAVRRIEASNDAEARKYLAGAQESFTRAVLSIRNNDIAGADRQLNEATSLIGKARQLVPDPLTRDIEHRVRYVQVLESVESLRASYQRHLQRARGQPPGTPVDDAHLFKAAQLVDAAKSLANSERIAQANQALSEAERVLMVGLTWLLGTRTIEYAQRFETLAEEYAYELERNGGYAELVPIALTEFKPGSEAIREVQSLLDANRRLREQAQRHAAKKDHRAALAVLRRGTAQLQGALAVAGLRVPTE